MIGVCGDNCSCCPRYLATQARSLEGLEKVKELWVRLGLRDRDFSVHNLACSGCTPKNTCAYSKVRDCAYEKGIDNCGLCQEYPCESIMAVFEKSKELKAKASDVCSQEEIEVFDRAFFSKEKNLDQVRSNTK